MKTYRVSKYFSLTYTHTTVFFPVNTHWNYLGECNGYIRMARKNIFVDVTKSQLDEFFTEMKNND